MNLRFYHCDICGKTIAVLSDTEIPTDCCGQTMHELAANRTDGAAEKHVPVFSTMGNTVLVRVGSAPHPMMDNHSITWIALSTVHGFQFRELHPGDRPEVSFFLHPKDHAVAAYAFCNLHGLWCSEKENDA